MTASPELILAGFRFLGWLLPAPRLDELTDESYESLRKKYRARDRWGNLIGLVALMVFAAMYYLVISWVTTLAVRRFADAKFLLQPMKLEYVIMAAFLSLVSSTYYTFLALKWYLGKTEYDIYLAYGACRLQGHFHVEKAFMWFFLLLFPALGAVGAMRATMFTAFTETAMFDANFCSFGAAREHRYAEIRDIYFAKAFHARFEDKLSPRYVIVFKDGIRWRTDAGAGGAKLDQQAAMVQYAAKQAGLRIRPVVFIEDIPP